MRNWKCVFYDYCNDEKITPLLAFESLQTDRQLISHYVINNVIIFPINITVLLVDEVTLQPMVARSEAILYISQLLCSRD